jgi:hypothetical protein
MQYGGSTNLRNAVLFLCDIIQGITLAISICDTLRLNGGNASLSNISTLSLLAAIRSNLK